MPKLQLTDLTIRNLKPADRQTMYFDKNMHGFGVRVSTGGTKTFALMYGPNRRLVSIGRVGVISLADARKEAKKVLAEHTLGKIRPEAITYQNALDEFLEESSRLNKPRTTNDYRRLLTRHFKFGKTRLGEITQKDIKQRLAKLNPTPSEKRHAYAAIRRLMRWAVGNQYIPHSPVDGIKVENQKSRERVLTSDEIGNVLEAALKQETMFDSIVALLLLTGQRRGEIGALQWDWINGDVITLPETKSGRVHMFPLGNLAQQVISKVPQTSEYLFPATVSHIRGKPTTTFNGWGKAKAEFDSQLQKVEAYTLHDLRRTFATNLAMLGTPIHVTERLLNHVSGTHSGVVGVYQRYSYMDEMREALSAYDAWLAACLR